MTLINYLNEKSMLLADIVSGWAMKKSFSLLMQSQWWDEEQIKDYQLKMLIKLVHYSYSYVPYYRELFDREKLHPTDINRLEDLNLIPLLTKEIIRKNFPDKLIAQNMNRKTLILGGSSGSTGQPIQFYKTKPYIGMHRAANLRGWYWAGFRLGDPYMKISSMPRNTMFKKLQDFYNRSMFVHKPSMGKEDICYILNLIKKKKILVLRGYPGSLYILANYLEKLKDHSYHMKFIITTSEPLYPYLRDKIENMFHCKIFDSYGAEGSPVIFECPTHNCYHIADELGIVEFMSIGGSSKQGKAKMVMTDLLNYATPFIRYDVKDIAIQYESKCSCGRCLTPLTSIEGRDADMLVTPCGNYVTFQFFVVYFKHHNYINLFQMRQTDLDRFVLYLVPNENFNMNLLKQIKTDVMLVLGKGATLSIEIVEDIPLTKSGKRRFFVRDSSVPIEI